ncbi:hypothetical protein B0J11DRAFT_169860 [Dendryphion nanum]|uniref:Uncharacterized protein n=1 Tax=Dendryphion nanum TaxID=256645 RepID=A0A9P9EDR1_9PLEO|nr:hypothetical protein B0J11DRAFT_169860 [Dendryphion nanum]
MKTAVDDHQTPYNLRPSRVPKTGEAAVEKSNDTIAVAAASAANLSGHGTLEKGQNIPKRGRGRPRKMKDPPAQPPRPSKKDDNEIAYGGKQVTGRKEVTGPEQATGQKQVNGRGQATCRKQATLSDEMTSEASRTHSVSNSGAKCVRADRRSSAVSQNVVPSSTPASSTRSALRKQEQAASEDVDSDIDGEWEPDDEYPEVPASASANRVFYQETPSDSIQDGQTENSVRPIAFSGTAHYQLAPTVPSPFQPDLSKSLDVLIEFARNHADLVTLTTTMLKAPESSTNWPQLIIKLFTREDRCSDELKMYLLEELLFLVTRTLLPDAIAMNRGLMYELYMARPMARTGLMLR